MAPRVRCTGTFVRAVAAASVVASALLLPAIARAQESARPDETFTVMRTLAQHGRHDLEDERWNVYGQLTYISNWKLPMSAGYTDLNGSNHSLLTNEERSFSATFTAFLGAKLWKGAEVYVVPEVISLKPLSHLTGLGGAIQNAELQKTGGETPVLYMSRAYLQQTIDLGGEPDSRASMPMQLGARTRTRRLVVRVGDFSALDFMDKNSLAGDLRQQFMNMDFLTYSAYDFAADARGYAYGAEADLRWDDFTLRASRLTVPVHPNQEAIDFRLDKYYGDQIELEHRHAIRGQSGAVRILGYRNREDMGRFDDAISALRANPTENAASCTSFNYGSSNAAAPDLCWARKPNVKLGIGVSFEQSLSHDVGVFFRGMYSDGQTEVYSFVSSDRSVSGGVLARGTSWHRPHDLTGLAVAVSWLSQAHIDYLRLGGVDGFLGEHVVEAFYSVNFLSSLWLTFDYQHIQNPAYNSDRGPAEVLSGRLHAEF
jgi:high affinity Mn2+ porin